MIYSKEQQLKSKRRKPKMKERTKITHDQYERAIEEWGNTCFCSNPGIEMHHVTFRSNGGKGGYRNLHPLCRQHHTLAHTDNEFRRHLEIQHKRRYGANYWMDAYDLHDRGLIAEPMEEQLERYFERVHDH